MSETREALIRAAVALVEEGETSPGLRQIARRAGVSHGAPYRHFSGYEEIKIALAERGFQQMMTRCVEAQTRADADPLSRFHAIGVAYLRFAWDHPGWFGAMFDPETMQEERVQSAQAAVYSLAVMTISSAQRQDLMAPGDPQELAMLAWSAVHGFATLRLGGLVDWLGRDHHDLDALAHRFTRSVFLGMRPDPEC